MSCECDFTDVYFNNDHRIVLTGLKDIDDNYLNAATITYQFYEIDNDTLIDGASGSLSATGTGGNYVSNVDQAIINLLDNGQEYYCRITGTQSGADFEFNIKTRAGRRGKN